MKYAHEIAEEAVVALAPDSTDAFIAGVLADYLLVGKAAPITLAINHNAKASPCPVRIDRPGVKSCLVTHRNVEAARIWAVDALMRNYEVTCGTRKGQETRSIAGERRAIANRERMAAYRAQRATTGKDPDDDIPF